MAITLLITDATQTVITDPIATWASLEATPKFNDVGAGQLVAPASDALLTAVNTAGCRVVVIRDGVIFASGPVEKPGTYAWSAGDAATAPPGQVTVNFGTNEVGLAWRLTYPDPAVASTAQTLDVWSATAANAETIMRSLVNLNAGPGALTARRVPHLALGALAAVGSSIDFTTRFETLTDALRKVALAGGGLGFRVRDTGSQLLFEVYQPPDRTGSVRFSTQLGNLRSITTDPEAPTCTAAIVGGSGTGGSRLIVERTATSGWGRIEKWVNAANDTDTTIMQQNGDAALTEGAQSVNLSAVAVDSQFARYGIDYDLGSKVSVEIAAGMLVSDVVTAVKLTATPDAGELISPTIGTGTKTTDTRTVDEIRQLSRRVSRLERS